MCQPAFGALPKSILRRRATTVTACPESIADLTAARPVHLAIMDGVKTMAGGQTPDPWCTPVKPGVRGGNQRGEHLRGGRGRHELRSPRAQGHRAFRTCDNKLLLAEQLGAGSCDPSRIEVIGPSVQEVKFDFRALREKLRALRPNRPYGGRGGIHTKDR